MSNYKEVSNFFTEKGPVDIEQFVNKNLDITEQVYSILEKKGWTQKRLAKEVDKSDAEISKWLSGTHNLTLKSIAKLEAILGEDVIVTPLKAKEKYRKIEYITFKVHINKPNMLDEHLESIESGQITDCKSKSKLYAA